MAVDIAEVKTAQRTHWYRPHRCQSRLEEAKGDFDKALGSTPQKGLTRPKSAVSAKPAPDSSQLQHDGRIGVLVEVNCEN